MAGIAWWFGFRDTNEPEVPIPQAPEIAFSEGLAIYTNGEYGFLIAYPETAAIEDAFSGPRMGARWSISAETDGQPITQITTYRVAHEASYPRDYMTLVRIGMSEGAADVRSCTEVRNGEVAEPDRSIGGESWSAFTYADAAMMQYVEGKSFRKVHNGACWAVEALRTGSRYRDDAEPVLVPDAELDAAYTRTLELVDSFHFAR